jgi:hypothetical protein
MRLLGGLGDVLRYHFNSPRFHVEQLELFGSTFDGARRGWNCPTMIVTVYVKRHPSMPLLAQCVLFT